MTPTVRFCRFPLPRGPYFYALPHSLGPVAATSSSVAEVENTAPSPGGFVRTGSSSATASNTAGSGRGPWYLGPRPLSVGVFQCLLQIARTSDVDRWVL